MDFFLVTLTKNWSCNEACKFYRSKYDFKNLGDVLYKIKEDLIKVNKAKSYHPNLHSKAAIILEDWNVSIKVIESKKYCTVQSTKGCFFTFKLFEIFCLKSTGSGGGTGYVPFLNLF
ncbi:unnamed protein product [Rhizophagus irregularis]|nr:unnamed protein product [Rhizophagus irregularis]